MFLVFLICYATHVYVKNDFVAYKILCGVHPYGKMQNSSKIPSNGWTMTPFVPKFYKTCESEKKNIPRGSMVWWVHLVFIWAQFVPGVRSGCEVEHISKLMSFSFPFLFGPGSLALFSWETKWSQVRPSSLQ